MTRCSLIIGRLRGPSQEDIGATPVHDIDQLSEQLTEETSEKPQHFPLTRPMRHDTGRYLRINTEARLEIPNTVLAGPRHYRAYIALECDSPYSSVCLSCEIGAKPVSRRGAKIQKANTACMCWSTSPQVSSPVDRQTILGSVLTDSSSTGVRGQLPLHSGTLARFFHNDIMEPNRLCKHEKGVQSVSLRELAYALSTVNTGWALSLATVQQLRTYGMVRCIAETTHTASHL